MSSTSSTTSRSLIFTGINFNGNDNKLLKGLKVRYSGVETAVKLYRHEENEKAVDAIQINVESDRAVQQFLGQTHLNIFKQQYLIQTVPRSLIVSKVSSNDKVEQIMQDLAHNYLGVERVFRFYNAEDLPVDSIQINFKSDASMPKILKDKYIIIDGKRRPVQPYWSCTYISDENDCKPVVIQPKQPVVTQKPPVPNNSQVYLTERRVQQLFYQQQMQLESMIGEFEKKWESRLASLTTPSNNVNTDRLTTIIRELSNVSQQFNQQNAQIQRQLGLIVHQARDTQMKTNGEQTQVLVQNGH